MHTLNKISTALEKFADYLTMVLITVMSVVYFSAVFARFVLDSGITWAEELTRYSNVMLVMFGSSVAARFKDHINVSAVESAIKNPTIKNALFNIQQLITGGFFLVVAIVGFQFAQTAIHVSPTMRVPMMFVYGLVSVACLLTAFQSFVYILNHLKGKEGAH